MSNQINRQNINKLINPISFSQYEIIQDQYLGGYKLKLNWDAQPNVLYYKIYKAILPKTFISKNYEINQKTLEKVSPVKNINGLNNNILYNRNILNIKQNPINQPYLFFPIAQITNNNSATDYHFYDKNIKFLTGYSYVITCVNSSLQETPKGTPLCFTVEDLQQPEKPENVYATDSPEGICLTIQNKNDNRIVSFKILKRNTETEITFKECEIVSSQNGVAVYIDKNVISGNEYEYKIFSIDFYGTLSLDSKKITKGVNSFFINDATIPYPEIEISNVDDNLLFKAKKNHKNLLGIKIERKDLWMYETAFTIKQYSSNIWPSVILFDNNGIAQFKDNFIQKSKKYQYRISNILKNNQVGSYSFSPIIDLDNFKDITINPIQNENNNFKLKSFNIDVANHMQYPTYLKCIFNIDGYWDYTIFDFKDKQIKIDSYNQKFYIPFFENKNNIFDIIFYKNDIEISRIKNMMVNTK